ncbi:MAG: hypothetical protein IJ412_00240 [Oscillospiraceae bacterium]|nr:hypothetical protein [Oscillospiraceae bacterium]
MEENKLTPGQEPVQEQGRFDEMLNKAMAELTEKGAEVKEEIAEVKEELAETVAELKEELAEAVAGAREEFAEWKEELTGEEEIEEEAEAAAEETGKKKKAKKEKQPRVAKSLFIGVSALEWLSTLSFCGVILLLGFLMGQAVQTGAEGMELLRMGLSNWYSNVQLIALVVFGVMYVTLVKKHSAAWLCIPALAFVGTAVWISLAQGIIPGINAYNALLEYMTNAEGKARLLKDLIRMLIPILLPYIVQVCMVIGFCFVITGRGCRWVQLAWCLVWSGLTIWNLVGTLQGDFVKIAPQLMMILAMVAVGALFALPGFVGKKVPKTEFAALRAADLAAYAAAKNKTAAAEAPAEAAAEEVAEEIAEEITEEITEEVAEEITEVIPAEEPSAEETPAEETPAEE